MNYRMDEQVLDRGKLGSLEQPVSRNRGVEDTTRESSKGAVGRTIGNWRKGDPRYTVAESLATLSSVVKWKTELVPNELRVLAQEIFQEKY